MLMPANRSKYKLVIYQTGVRKTSAYFVDDVTIPGQGLNDLEAGLGNLAITSEAQSAATPNNWIRLVPEDFPEGPVIRSDDTVYMGFGFEAIETEADRNKVMKNIMEYFLDDDDYYHGHGHDWYDHEWDDYRG